MSKGLYISKGIRETWPYNEVRELSNWEALERLAMFIKQDNRSFTLEEVTYQLPAHCCLVSVRDLAREWRWGTKKVRSYLDRLMAEKWIQLKPLKVGTLVMMGEKGHTYLERIQRPTKICVKNENQYSPEGHTFPPKDSSSYSDNGHTIKKRKKVPKKEKKCKSYLCLKNTYDESKVVKDNLSSNNLKNTNLKDDLEEDIFNIRYLRGMDIPSIMNSINFQPPLDTKPFKTSFGEWLKHKKVSGKMYRSFDQIEIMLRRWGRYGEQACIEAIEFSISNNYAGAFPEQFAKDKKSSSLVAKFKREEEGL